MRFKRIGDKMLAVVGITVTLGLIATAWFFTAHQEHAVLAQNERTMRKLTESVIHGLTISMQRGHAEIAQAYAARLRGLADVEDFRILRVDGSEAFRNPKPFDPKRPRRYEPPPPQTPGQSAANIPPDQLRKVVAREQPVAFYETDARGEKHLTFVAPIRNDVSCHRCHDEEINVLGVLKLATSLAPVERDIAHGRKESLLVLGAALFGTLLLTGLILKTAVVRRIEAVTAAMRRASDGDLEQKVPVTGGDELAQMASSFNIMAEALHKLTMTDSLTGLYNRRQLDERLQRELDRARRYGEPLSILMCDVDHFKLFNDIHGHEQGDRVLQGVARAFGHILREHDAACRYGGEEFVAILPNTTAQGAFNVAERLRAEVEAGAIDGLRVTVSIGVAAYPDFDMSDQAKLVEAADVALYQAKASGRNRTCVASPA